MKITIETDNADDFARIIESLASRDVVPANNGELFMAYLRRQGPGDKVGAIKMLRARMGLSLRDSKMIVDSAMEGLSK